MQKRRCVGNGAHEVSSRWNIFLLSLHYFLATS
uniref:Uncharacterized protein n=1 Tax=Arundo donax TaxID=35708 RepID=A0A0A8YKT5_ARUDO